MNPLTDSDRFVRAHIANRLLNSERLETDNALALDQTIRFLQIEEKMSENIVLKIDQILGILAEPRLYAMSRIQLFLTQCFLPGVFYDIGANDPFSAEGQQTIYKPIMPQTKFFLFEAMAKHEPDLIRSGEPYAIAILDEQDGMTKTFYQSKAYPPGNGDSLYLERTAY